MTQSFRHDTARTDGPTRVYRDTKDGRVYVSVDDSTFEGHVIKLSPKPGSRSEVMLAHLLDDVAGRTRHRAVGALADGKVGVLATECGIFRIDLTGTDAIVTGEPLVMDGVRYAVSSTVFGRGQVSWWGDERLQLADSRPALFKDTYLAISAPTGVRAFALLRDQVEPVLKLVDGWRTTTFEVSHGQSWAVRALAHQNEWATKQSAAHQKERATKRG